MPKTTPTTIENRWDFGDGETGMGEVDHKNTPKITPIMETRWGLDDEGMGMGAGAHHTHDT